jgi:hypothetical protein
MLTLQDVSDQRLSELAGTAIMAIVNGWRSGDAMDEILAEAVARGKARAKLDELRQDWLGSLYS